VRLLALAPLLPCPALPLQFIKREHVAWDAYVWAAELWYAYAIQVSSLEAFLGRPRNP